VSRVSYKKVPLLPLFSSLLPSIKRRFSTATYQRTHKNIHTYPTVTSISKLGLRTLYLSSHIPTSPSKIKMEASLLLSVRAALSGESLKVKKLCRLTKWLLATQNKLCTTINRSSDKTCSPSKSSSSKSSQHRRIHNEIFGWTSDAWDEMSDISTYTSPTTPSSASPSPPTSSAPTTPQTGSMSREEALIRADNYTIRRIEHTVMQNTTTRHSQGRKAYYKIAGYEY
jgi:hypothetical protein